MNLFLMISFVCFFIFILDASFRMSKAEDELAEAKALSFFFGGMTVATIVVLGLTIFLDGPAWAGSAVTLIAGAWGAGAKMQADHARNIEESMVQEINKKRSDMIAML